MINVEDPVELVETRQVAIGDERFELRVEREVDKQIRATVFQSRRMVKIRLIDSPAITVPLRRRLESSFKADLHTREGRAAVAQLLVHLETDLRVHHPRGTTTFD